MTEPETEPEIGYGCICGFKTTDKVEFTSHVMFEAQKDGKGTHKSIGRVDTGTGEVVTPPYAGRSADEKRQTKTKVNKGGNGGGGGGGGSGGGGSGGAGVKASVPQLQATKELGDAQQVRVVPKIFTMDYTPVMRMAQDAAVKVFGWRMDMPFENFLDTCLYLFFFEKGITLCGYIVNDSLIEKEEKNNGS